MDRRSFLAAVVGAVAASALPKRQSLPALPDNGIDRFDAMWAELREKCSEQWYRHYTVWDSAVVRPGELLRERLLPPPVPDDFAITKIGAFYSADSPYKSLAAVCKQVSVSLQDGEQRIIEAPLYLLPNSYPMELVIPYRHLPGQDLGIWLGSLNPVECSEPVTVSIVLSGIVLSPGASVGPRLNRLDSLRV